MNRRLYRCRHDRKLAGVAAGVAEYFDADPTLVRILWLLSIFFGGLGILAYIGMALIVPLEPLSAAEAEANQAAGTADGTAIGGGAGSLADPAGHLHRPRGDGRWTTVIGAGLILLGSLALLDNVLPRWVEAGRWLGPSFVIGIGILLVVNAIRRDPSPS